jgi:hypothetical protein
VIGAYHQLFQIEKSFPMAKSDPPARPIYHRIRDSIEAHLTIVFAALAVNRWIEHLRQCFRAPTTGPSEAADVRAIDGPQVAPAIDESARALAACPGRTPLMT